MAAAAAAERADHTPSATLTEKFIRGLESYSITFSEVFLSQWRYCGGDKGPHRNYYKLTHPDYELPPHTDECVCGHPIKENCYITDGEQFLVLGNCCIKKFLKKENSGRTCGRCGQPHKNRSDNLCKACREIIKKEAREREEEERRKLRELMMKLEEEKRQRQEEQRKKEEEERRKCEEERREQEIAIRKQKMEMRERMYELYLKENEGKEKVKILEKRDFFLSKRVELMIEEEKRKKNLEEMKEVYAAQRASLCCACGIHVCKCETPTYELYALNGKYICTTCKNWKCRCAATDAAVNT
jgi:hypothetical protein